MVKAITKSKKGEIKKEPKAPARYFEGIGGRKSSVARVRLSPGHSDISVNGKDFRQYFKIVKYQEVIAAPLEAVKGNEKFGASVKVKGGGLTGQAEAIRHGIARALVKFNEEFRAKLAKLGYMTRDSRKVERKKYGLKKARRAPQWAKR